MNPWAERSPELAALLNPAFCGMLLYSAIDGFVERGGVGMPYEISFLVLPLVLHEQTRGMLPKSIATPFQTWVSGNPTLRIGLAERVRAAIPISREALVFLLVRQSIDVRQAALMPGLAKPRLSAAKTSRSSDVRGCVQSAALLGRLLATSGRSATVYASLGIAP
jgi:hypothetical protein